MGSAMSSKFILFRIDQKYFALKLLVVKEVILQKEIEDLPRATQNVKGIINLRGKIIPIVNISRILEISPHVNERPNLLVIDSKDTSSDYGFEVDEVIEVTKIEEDQLQEHAQSESKLKKFIQAIVAQHPGHEDKVIYVLNELISEDELKEAA